MVVNVKDHVNHCYTNADGDIIRNLIQRDLENGLPVTVSFIGIHSVSSSFVNSAFIALLDTMNFGLIRANLHFINSNKQINDMIKKSFYFEVNDRPKLLNV